MLTITENTTKQEIWETLQQLLPLIEKAQSLADDWANKVGEYSSRIPANKVSNEIFIRFHGFDDLVDRIGELLCSDDSTIDFDDFDD